MCVSCLKINDITMNDYRTRLVQEKNMADWGTDIATIADLRLKR